ncbi:MAG: hypothetical protein HKO66_08960 [Saprospiraceae bacterium]|nr:hypothetical protein [Saprospiraceae bacterium]
MENKINDLFEYRKLPFLLSFLGKKERKSLMPKLVKIQEKIYNLDGYLEQNWKLKPKKLSKYWKAINNSIAKLGYDHDQIEKMTSHIKRYELHESQLRSYKLPTRISLEYFYYYKSCDVRLLREIIYDKYKNDDNVIKLSDWRIYDLVTEINDDIEDVFEDQKTINCNYYLISILEEGVEEAEKKYSLFLNALLKRSITKFSKSKQPDIIKLHYYTVKRIRQTLALLTKQNSLISNKKSIKKTELSKYFEF